ncbi:hypothetical protein E3N88_31518 [Mikania micrantha]|uniref:Uncharacterized protein n=1 Tax=Mikania micrantha TaxID=192012 RepID=A0A5N6MSL9_9ASTR|nr:hypothetical protein E3N88_31518 [Mikania micrantha]
MASKPLLSNTLLSSSLFCTTLIPPPSTVAQCPYACGNTPPATTVPPPVTMLPPPSPTGTYPPPAVGYSPPMNVFPYNPPTPTYYGGAPPPPDPIVPWFPFTTRIRHMDWNSSQLRSSEGFRTRCRLQQAHDRRSDSTTIYNEEEGKFKLTEFRYRIQEKGPRYFR